MNKNELSLFLEENFIKYTKIASQSDGSQHILPSTPGQTVMLAQLHDDLESLGVKELTYQHDAILIAKIPKTVDNACPMAFMSHVDTVDIGVNPEVNAQTIKFNGQDFFLNEDKGIIFKVDEHKEINNYLNDTIIVTDGTSVLGADDKAGVTVMVGLAKYLMENSISHGDIYLIFVPDEEIGLRGAYALDVAQLPKNILSYTIDGGPLGEFGYETFNAAAVSIYIKGVSIHPGQAKGILVNPILVANDLIAKLDRYDTPEHSEGKEGFILVTDIKGNATEAEIELIIRDFDLDGFNNRKILLQQLVADIQHMHPKSQITIEINDSYSNIANTLTADAPCISLVKEAMANLKIPIHIDPVRGGTDGAVLSVKGIPTPNIFTGAHDIHSVYEYLPLSSFTKSLETVIEMVKLSIKY